MGENCWVRKKYEWYGRKFLNSGNYKKINAEENIGISKKVKKNWY